jgi:hypothetical protein
VFTSAPLNDVFQHPLTIGTDPATGYATVTPIRR